MHLEVHLVLAECERSVTMEYFEHEDSECPYVSFGPVDIFEQSLRAHIDWATDIDIFEAIPGVTHRLTLFS